MISGFTLFTADSSGNAHNTIYPHRIEVKSLDDFRRAMAYDHVCAEYKGAHRSVVDFISADCVMFDCDNDHSDYKADWVLPEDVQKAFPGVRFFVCYSRHHNVTKGGKSPRPKFHVYFAIDPLTDAKTYSSLKDRVIALFPHLHFDTNALDSARFFFGVNSPQVACYEGSSYEVE